MITRVGLHVLVVVLLAIAPGCAPQAQQQPAPDAADQRDFDRERLNASSSEIEAPDDTQRKKSNRNNRDQSLSQEPPRPQRKEKILLDVPLVAQNPELKYGCEVTSLAMILKYAGIQVGKMELADKVKKDPDRLQTGKGGDITHWGDPNEGFVGDITGKQKGYAIYAEPLEDLMKKYLPGRTVNLTGQPFEHVLRHLSTGKPVVTWTTGDYKLPDRWESWKHGNEQITTPLDLHAVVLAGYDPDYVYLNDPLSARKAVKVNKKQFIDSWHALGSQALSYH
ncbi:peptidase C39 [Paenibacillus dendritiformis]|uniref:C39 family peptidase n=1 Tax=Paenibacillus dendritiformis TaxID=130049 RepID=UPI0018CF91CD|nr:C39 family peptidase [Paenibacillus dendritiformis]MBG9791057.1 peptidase C39 [Paenibacillus dendritiformis]